MNTKIRLTANGNFSPNVIFDLGNKYESVGDTLEFILPEEYKKETNHYYLTFKMKKLKTMILPVNDFKFIITRTITEHPGTYEIIFLATENEVVNDDIDEASLVYISNVMQGRVKDNYLTDPITEEVQDKNIEIYYNKLDALYDEMKLRHDTNYYQGDYYFPNVDEFGYLTWTIKDGKASDIPTGQNITGPEGPYYVPSIEDGLLFWEVAQSSTRPEGDSYNIGEKVNSSTDEWLNENFEERASDLIFDAVNKGVDEKFKFAWDDENQILYITASDYDSESGAVPESEIHRIYQTIESIRADMDAIVDINAPTAEEILEIESEVYGTNGE